MNTNSKLAVVGISALIVGGAVGYVAMPAEVVEVEVVKEVSVTPESCSRALVLSSEIMLESGKVMDTQSFIIYDVFPRAIEAVASGNPYLIDAITYELQGLNDQILSVDISAEMDEYLEMVADCTAPTA